MAGPFLSREQSREIDRRASDEYGLAGIVLMENAGRGVVDVLDRLGIAGPIVVLCGGGNNAGDGFVIARHLEIRGYECRVLLLSDPAKLTGDALCNYQVLQCCDVPINDLTTDSADARKLRESLDGHTTGAHWLVDAMLGTGARGTPRPPLDMVIDWMNDQGVPILAVDVPSGLDCDTGEASPHTVRASHTCTFVAAKRGFAVDTVKEYTGQVHVVSIGTPPKMLRELLSEDPPPSKA